MSCTRQTHDVDRVFNVGLMLVWCLRSCSNVDPTLVKCVVFAGYITYLVNVVPVHVHLYETHLVMLNLLGQYVLYIYIIGVLPIEQGQGL